MQRGNMQLARGPVRKRRELRCVTAQALFFGQFLFGALVSAPRRRSCPRRPTYLGPDIRRAKKCRLHLAADSGQWTRRPFGSAVLKSQSGGTRTCSDYWHPLF
jgi:hypothetical protein